MTARRMTGWVRCACAALAMIAAGTVLDGCNEPESNGAAPTTPVGNTTDGQQIFRNDSFGDEQFWTGTLQMHQVIASAVDPMTALKVGLKVDAAMLPAGILQQVDLTAPATTVALLKMNAVVGLKATVVSEGGKDTLAAVGVTCALCHSTVDDSVAPGIGNRLDGYPNRDLDPGAIIALSPALTAEQKAVYSGWGPGKYDPRYNIDGLNDPVLIPPAYGLRQSPHTTYSGDGDIRYWNNYVAVTKMGGQGSFKDDRLGVNKTLPAGTTDLVAPKLDALRDYQFSLTIPAPPAGSYDPAAAERGQVVFAVACGSCHKSNRGWSDEKLHQPDETGTDPTYASRSASKMYRATPLRALWQHPPYFHDGSAATLPAVVDHYDAKLQLGLTAEQKTDLLDYLRSI